MKAKFGLRQYNSMKLNMVKIGGNNDPGGGKNVLSRSSHGDLITRSTTSALNSAPV